MQQRFAWLISHPSGLHGISKHRDLRDGALAFAKHLVEKGLSKDAILECTVRELPSMKIIAAP